jgi:cation-transporting ATPase E
MIYAGQFSGLLFLVVLIPNILIGLIQDLRARYIIGKLRLTTSNKFDVVRDGHAEEVLPSEIVLDDIVKINNSDQIPVDGEIVHGFCFVNESLLTGESENIYKKPGDKVLSGSYVTSGTAYIHAEKVGEDNYVENLQNKANKFARSPSKILNSLRLLFRGIGIVVILMAVVSVITYAAQGKFATAQSVKESIASIAGSMVSMIPSGLYLLTSVALAVGVISLFRKRTAVQEMYSIEMLARTDVLCLDKTGTITDGSLQVKLLIPFSNKYSEEQLKQIISNVVSITNDTNATAIALKQYFNYAQTAAASGVLPFSSDTKFSAATLRGKGTYAIGALDFLNIKNKKGIGFKVEEYTSKGYRVLVLGHTLNSIIDNKIAGELEPIAMIVLKDKVREDAIETFKWFKDNGVDIKVISGDDPLTVSEIAREAGIEGFDRYISLAGKSLEEVKNLILYCDYTMRLL